MSWQYQLYTILRESRHHLVAVRLEKPLVNDHLNPMLRHWCHTFMGVEGATGPELKPSADNPSAAVQLLQLSRAFIAWYQQIHTQIYMPSLMLGFDDKIKRQLTDIKRRVKDMRSDIERVQIDLSRVQSKIQKWHTQVASWDRDTDIENECRKLTSANGLKAGAKGMKKTGDSIGAATSHARNATPMMKRVNEMMERNRFMSRILFIYFFRVWLVLNEAIFFAGETSAPVLFGNQSPSVPMYPRILAPSQDEPLQWTDEQTVESARQSVFVIVESSPIESSSGGTGDAIDATVMEARPYYSHSLWLAVRLSVIAAMEYRA